MRQCLLELSRGCCLSPQRLGTVESGLRIVLHFLFEPFTSFSEIFKIRFVVDMEMVIVILMMIILAMKVVMIKNR